jgi:hypothetical protein
VLDFSAGVVGSSVDIVTRAQVQTLSKAASVVAASLEKSEKAWEQQKAEGKVTAQALYNTPKLPPQINVSDSLEGRRKRGGALGGGECN